MNTEEFTVDFVQADDSTPTYTAEITVENELIHIGTTALNADTEGKEFNSAKEITITDTVSYEGLIPNQQYTMHATLMDKETGEPVLNEDGTPVEGFKKFTPEEANGTVNVKMTLDAKMISRTNAEALIPVETSSEIIKNVPQASAALSLFKQLPNMSAKQKTLPVTSTLPTAYFFW